MNPVGKDDESRELIHSYPWDHFAGCYIIDYFQCLRSFADCVTGMAGPAEFDVRDSCHTIHFNITMTEGAVQFRHLFMMDVVESDRLLDRDPGEDGEDRIKDAFCLGAESIVSDSGKQGDEDGGSEKIEPFLHMNYPLERDEACYKRSIPGFLCDRATQA